MKKTAENTKTAPKKAVAKAITVIVQSSFVPAPMPSMSRHRQLSAEVRAAIKLAAERRVEAVWTCLGVLCPDLTAQAKKALAEKVLDCAGRKIGKRRGF